MIALDTSALIAILFEEAEAAVFAELIEACDRVLIGAPTVFEFRMVVLSRSGATIERKATETLLQSPVEVQAFTADHLAAAFVAFDRYGKGRHPARLNFGDCMAYAVAAAADVPLLYKGDDFAQTDIRSAL